MVLSYKIQFECNKEPKAYEITLGTRKSSHPNYNPQILFLSEVKSFFSRNQSVINLLQILSNTSMLNKRINYFNAEILLNFNAFLKIILIRTDIREFTDYIFIYISYISLRNNILNFKVRLLKFKIIFV